MNQQAELPTEQENTENGENEENGEKEIVLQVSQKEKKKRNISEETREVMRERAKKALETRKKNLEIRKELGLHPHDPLPSKYQKKKPVQKNDGPLPEQDRVLTKGEDADKLRADSLEAKEKRRPCNINEENKLLKKQNKEYMLRDIVRSEFENCFERRRVEKDWARESVARKSEKAEKTEKTEKTEKVEKKKTLFKFADGTTIEV
jgi:hypothetical protein